MTARNPGTGGLYGDAMIYDVLHGPSTADEVALLSDLEERYVKARKGSGRVWLEPACGTARHLRAALRADRSGTLRVIGVDSSERMLEYARGAIDRTAVGAQAQLIHADIAEFSSKVRRKATFAFCLINSVRHLNTDRAMLEHFADVAATLRVGGVYVLGLHMARYEHDAVTRDVFSAARGRLRVKQYMTCIPALSSSSRLERVESVIRIGRPGHAETRHDEYTLRTYSLAQMRSLLRRSDLRPIAITDGDGEELDPNLPRRSGDDGYRLWILGRDEDTHGHPALI